MECMMATWLMKNAILASSMHLCEEKKGKSNAALVAGPFFPIYSKFKINGNVRFTSERKEWKQQEDSPFNTIQD